MKTFRALYPSEFRSVATARRAVAGFALECGFDREAVSDIALAAGEACNNAAEHGHVANGFFSVDCAFDGDTLSVSVQDFGHGFSADAEGRPMNPEDRGVRGLGIFIMRALSDGVRYATTNRGTKVELTKRLRSAMTAAMSVDGHRGSATRPKRSKKLATGSPTSFA